jgi:hypothetical protein
VTIYDIPAQRKNQANTNHPLQPESSSLFIPLVKSSGNDLLEAGSLGTV